MNFLLQYIRKKHIKLLHIKLNRNAALKLKHKLLTWKSISRSWDQPLIHFFFSESVIFTMYIMSVFFLILVHVLCSSESCRLQENTAINKDKFLIGARLTPIGSTLSLTDLKQKLNIGFHIYDSLSTFCFSFCDFWLFKFLVPLLKTWLFYRT